MSRARNEPIGEVDCPHRGCELKAKVYKFQARAAADGGRARFAGKLYADCSVHGRYGADGKPAAQEYLLENATIFGATLNGKPPAPAPAAPVKATPAAPAPAPVKPSLFERFGTLIK